MSKTKTAPAEPKLNFHEVGLCEAIVSQLDEMGFEHPTPIQEQAIPALLDGHDIIGRARTGSGKTAAFGLPLLQQVQDGGRQVRALVLTPTRELARQIGEALTQHAKNLPEVRVVTIYGGAPYPPQVKALKAGCSVVVGTPGRVIDLLDSGRLDLSKLEIFVLDEADEMLRMGFIEDVEKLLAQTPEDRQVALFSATMPNAIRKVACTYLREPVEIQVEENALTVDHIHQQWLVVPNRNKVEALVRVLQGTPRGSTLVFARTRVKCGEIAEDLAKRGFGADALHGDLNQPARDRVLRRMRSGHLKLVVATDVAARGLDVDHLNLVINLDIPENKEIYVHRIGRTGRAGRAGTAITLVTPSQKHFIWGLEKSLDMKLTRIEIPSDAQVAMLQRSHLATELAAPEVPSEHGAKWLHKLAKQYNWSPEETAARALALLAERDGVSLVPEDECDQEPPRWAKDPRKPSDRRREWRGDRGRHHHRKDAAGKRSHGKPYKKRGGAPKSAGSSKGKKGKKPWFKKAR